MNKVLKIACIILMTWISGLACSFSATAPRKVVVGAKTFAEQHLLARMMTLMLEARGFEVEERVNMQTRIIRKALLEGKIDIYWEYTGTGFSAHLRQTDAVIAGNADQVYKRVKALDRENGVVWLNKATLNNSYALAIKKKRARELGLRTISDLIEKLNHKQKITFAIAEAFYYRPDGFKKLMQHYGFNMPANFVTPCQLKNFYHLIMTDKVDIIEAYATDARIRQYGLMTLEDDRHFFAIYNPAPTVLESTLAKMPELGIIANQIGPLLDTKVMIDLNYQVEIEKKDVGEVARAFLVKKGLIP